MLPLVSDVIFRSSFFRKTEKSISCAYMVNTCSSFSLDNLLRGYIRVHIEGH